MNLRESSQTFEATRRQHLIDATIEALGDVGFKATSLSQIARRADVSTGLFAHYFGDKDGLLEATLRFMAARLTRAARQRLRAARTPRERLYAVPDSALADQEFERRTSAVWLAFWGQITHSARYKQIQIIYQCRMTSNLRHDLRALVPPPCVEIYAKMIASMIDGVWLRSHASPKQGDAANARAMVRAFIDSLIDGTGSPPIAVLGATDAPAIRRSDSTQGRSVVEVVSPVTKACLGRFPAGRGSDIVDAVARGRRGIVAWARMPASDRERVLRRCAEALRADGAELARLDALCTGRAIAQTIAFGVPAAARIFEHFAPVASRPTSERVELGAGLFRETRHEPVGVVAGFGHWSAPVLDACRQIAPALAFGNAMIFQPDADAPLSARRLEEIFAHAGVPPGLLTILQGDRETARLLRGAVDTSAPQTGLAPKATAIVFASAAMDEAARAILHGGCGYAPTPDLSETVVFVQRSGLTTFRARLLAHIEGIRCGNPLARKTQVGTLISQRHLQRVRALIAQAVDAGASQLAEPRANRPRGLALAPTVLDGCALDMPIVRESIFAPVLTLLAFEDDDEIVAIFAKQREASPVGLYDTDGPHALRVANQLRASFCCLDDSGQAVGDAAGLEGPGHGDTGTNPDVYCRRKRIIFRDARPLEDERPV